MENLEKFYNTLNRVDKFSELTINELNTLHESKAYNRYLKNESKSLDVWFKWLKYAFNIAICCFLAVLLSIYLYYHMDKHDDRFEIRRGIIKGNASQFKEGDSIFMRLDGSLTGVKCKESDEFVGTVIKD